MNAPRCARCGHPDHTHSNQSDHGLTLGKPCHASDVTGPASDLGHPTGPSYNHGGRTVIECGCRGYRPPLAVVS